MAFGEQEPTAAVLAPPTDEVLAPTEPAAQGTDEAVVADSGAASDALDLDTEAGLAAALERSALLRGRLEKAQNDGFQNGRQNRDAELRRDEGTAERAQAYHEWLTSQVEAGYDPAEIAKQTPLFVKANQDTTRSELGKAWVEASLGHFGEQEQEVIRGVMDTLTDPTMIGDLASKTWEAAASKVRQAAVANLSLDQIPKTSTLHTEIQALVDAKLTAELAAREIEATRQPTAPRANGSAPGSVGMTTNQARLMTPEAAAQLPDAEYAEWKRMFFAASATG